LNRLRWGNGTTVGVRLFKTTWTTPPPDVLVESIDFASSMADPAPFLIAITAQ